MVPLLGSCSFHQPFPAEWKPPESSNTACPNIDGKYLNEGEGKDPQYKPTLAWYLFRQSAPWKETTHVSFTRKTDASVEVILWNGNKKLFQRDLRTDEKEVSCQEGFLKINTREYVSDGGALGKEWSVIGLARSQDYLVVRNESGAVGLFFLFPVAGTATDWYRFRAIGE